MHLPVARLAAGRPAGRGAPAGRAAPWPEAALAPRPAPPPPPPHGCPAGCRAKPVMALSPAGCSQPIRARACSTVQALCWPAGQADPKQIAAGRLTRRTAPPPAGRPLRAPPAAPCRRPRAAATGTPPAPPQPACSRACSSNARCSSLHTTTHIIQHPSASWATARPASYHAPISLFALQAVAPRRADNTHSQTGCRWYPLHVQRSDWPATPSTCAAALRRSPRLHTARQCYPAAKACCLTARLPPLPQSATTPCRHCALASCRVCLWHPL